MLLRSFPRLARVGRSTALTAVVVSAAVAAIVGGGCHRRPEPPPPATTAPPVDVAPRPAFARPNGPWSAHTLHLWTTSCDPASTEALGVIAAVDAHRPSKPSVGLACQVVLPTGELAIAGDPKGADKRRALTVALHAAGARTALVVANPGTGGFDGALGARVLHDETTRTRLGDALVALQRSEHHDEIEIDLEGMPTSAASDLVALVRAVRASADVGVPVSVDVHPKTVDDPGWDGPGSHDYAALAGAGAIVRLMTYDFSIGPVPPGPTTKASWVREVVAYARQKGVPPGQLDVGLPAYGYDFPLAKGATPVPLRWGEIIALSRRTKATAVRDPQSTPHFAYDAKDGHHQVWFDDATSLGAVLADLAPIAGDVRAVAVWGIAGADPKLIAALADAGL